MSIRLAIVSTHPIQYYAPWFAQLATRPELELHVFYLWDFGVQQRRDAGFGIDLKWDIDLLQGYAHSFVPNVARDPGTHHFAGIDNPQLRALLRSFAPQVLLMFGYAFKSMLGLLLRPPCPLLLRGDSHDLATRSGRIVWARRWLQRLLFSRASAALPVGKANHAYWRARGLRERQLFLAPHCVDNARFRDALPQARAEATQLRAQLGVSADMRLLLFAGKFEEKKQPLALIQAFIELAPDNARLLLVGDGALRPDIEAAASTHPDSIVVWPFQNQSHMPALYAAADLLILPSQGSGETWGLSINEAMCMGTPVLVSTHVGCQQDLVIEGSTGYVFAAGDAHALREALRRALSDDDERQRRAQHALQQIHHYSYEQATSGLLAAIRQLKTVA